MKKYKFLEHTADVLFRAYGDDPNELFENAAEALESVMIDLKSIDVKGVKRVNLSADTYENLLFDWLSEIIVLFEVDSFAIRKFNVKIRDKSLSAECSGERIDKSKHKLKLEVKAVTYHNLEIMRHVRCYVDVTLDV
jgi:SHS2 domain-containing protein